MKKIYLASPRGFCAGVDRALDVVEYSLQIYGSPLYVRHEIVHNRFIVDELRKKGVVFVDDVHQVPENEVIIFSAHGVSPLVRKQAEERKLQIIDATCPLVTKVHREIVRFAEMGYTILLIGHKKHVETEGTMGEAPEKTIIIENEEDAARVEVKDPSRVAFLTQTTLSIDDAKSIISILEERFPSIQGPKKSDICYATTNRQEAVKYLAKISDLILVIGSPNSSNSNRLREIASAQDVDAYLIDSAAELNPKWLEKVESLGITAGASAPEILVQELLHLLQKEYGFHSIEEKKIIEEKVTFQLPEIIQQARQKLQI